MIRHRQQNFLADRALSRRLWVLVIATIVCLPTAGALAEGNASRWDHLPDYRQDVSFLDGDVSQYEEALQSPEGCCRKCRSRRCRQRCCCCGPDCKRCCGIYTSRGDGRKSLADKHAPAGLMGDHVHDPGEIMFEYKYMGMYMEDNRQGTTTLSDQQSFINGQALGTNFAATPTQMTMEMHMVHFMLGVTEDVTIYTMAMLHSNTMDHLRANPFPPNAPAGGPLASTPFTTHVSGFGDTTFGALWRVHETECEDVIVNLAFSVPTGDLTRTTSAPTNGAMNQEFPYPMRLGSGTFDARPGVTYKRYFKHGSTGLQFQTDLPIGRNFDNYAEGNEYRLNWWYSYLPADWLAFSYRVEGLWREQFRGADADLNQRLISTNRPDMRGGEWVNFGYGTMVLLPGGTLFNAEVVHPVYQNLNGIQLESDWWFNTSWSRAF